jgi:hypothetical protein
MRLETAIEHIRHCAGLMDSRYQRTVFDEWAIVGFEKSRAPRVVHYQGPRADRFLASFDADLAALRAGLTSQRYETGDFEFARQAAGTHFEAFMVVGAGLYLICNNTWATMDQIAANPLWLAAQVPFVELSERFRADPLTL